MGSRIPTGRALFGNILGAVAAAMRPLTTIVVATLFSEGTEEVQRVYSGIRYWSLTSLNITQMIASTNDIVCFIPQSSEQCLNTLVVYGILALQLANLIC